MQPPAFVPWHYAGVELEVGKKIYGATVVAVGYAEWCTEICHKTRWRITYLDRGPLSVTPLFSLDWCSGKILYVCNWLSWASLNSPIILALHFDHYSARGVSAECCNPICRRNHTRSGWDTFWRTLMFFKCERGRIVGRNARIMSQECSWTTYIRQAVT